MSELENKLAALKEDLATKEAAFAKENNSLVQTLASLQNMSLNPSEAVILQPLSPVDIIRSAILLRETVPFLNEKSSKLKTDLDSVYQQKKKVEETVAETKKRQELLEKQQAEMRTLMKKKPVCARCWKQKAPKRRNWRKIFLLKQKTCGICLMNWSDRKNLPAKTGRGRKTCGFETTGRIKTAKNAARYQYKRTRRHKKQAKGGRFAKAKGSLSRPVRGTVITEYGQMLSKGVTSKGIVYKTRPEAQVIAPYDGTVIFPAHLKDMVILL